MKKIRSDASPKRRAACSDPAFSSQNVPEMTRTQKRLSRRLELLCTRLGARNEAADICFECTVGDGLL